MRYFIDTNIFLRVFVKDNEKAFKECLVLLTIVKENKIEAYTSSIVLAEINWTLGSYYHFSKPKTIRCIKSILNLRGLKVEDKHEMIRALQLYEKNSVKYIDAVIASDVDILDKRATVVSFDKDFDKLKVLRKEPKQIIIPK